MYMQTLPWRCYKLSDLKLSVTPFVLYTDPLLRPHASMVVWGFDVAIFLPEGQKNENTKSYC